MAMASLSPAPPSRSQARRWMPPALEDFFEEDDVEVDYGEEDQEDDQGSEGEGSEEQEEGEDGEGSDGDDEEEEEGEGGDSAREGSMMSGRARISGVAGATGGAAERVSMPTCPVCMEAWTSDGPHRISCIPCGHVYGRSCLERWLTQRGNRSSTCPQCGKRFKHKDIINLYAPEVAIPNNELEKEILYLREKTDSLEKMIIHHGKLLEGITKKQIGTEQTIIDAGRSKRRRLAEHSDGAAHLEPSTSVTVNFSLQNELFLDGARVISIDASNQIILASGRATGVDVEHVLTKISMLSTHEACKIQLPPDTKAVRDMCILPGGSAIFTSLGRRLSLFSMTTNSVVLQCDLPAPGWSCSADVSSSRHVYAGLQNGMLLVFDIRQTARPLHSMVGLSAHPVHTLHSVIDNNGSRKVLSASAVGPCMWDADENQSRPHSLTGMEIQRVCISLACAPPSSDLLVASFRPKVDASEYATTSQVYLSQTPTRSGSGKLGHHTLLRRTGNMSVAEGTTCYANVSEVRMSKSAIIPYGDNQRLFAYGDESLRGVRTWQLPSFAIHADLCSHQQPILDLRYAESSGGGRYLGCLSEEKLQVFRIR
ncbi:uncharacterized protein LOC133911363 isoform X1 [Phragmites australis]|uniref:uncharacterized protein LOC133911363 isoform X1 n=1 Tax=Phragmites australis TaxID=29695 RepID=UPI002D766768|nr:uncharacterized protein LOC133911363 isoform X1 [Phragmites australis]